MVQDMINFGEVLQGALNQAVKRHVVSNYKALYVHYDLDKFAVAHSQIEAPVHHHRFCHRGHQDLFGQRARSGGQL